MQDFGEKVAELVQSGWGIKGSEAYGRWQARVTSFLSSALGDGEARRFSDLAGSTYSGAWERCLQKQVGHLEGLPLRMEATSSAGERTVEGSNRSQAVIQQSNKVFVVHGHDVEAKETVARFIERLRLEPIILHEQPDSGRTIIEKFEVYSDVGFAVVLLTPDDLGSVANSPEQLKPRARQNVILELGYFMGKLSRSRVCALYKEGVEIPSDYQGVLYVELDVGGAWRTKVAQELVEANFAIDLKGLLQG